MPSLFNPSQLWTQHNTRSIWAITVIRLFDKINWVSNYNRLKDGRWNYCFWLCKIYFIHYQILLVFYVILMVLFYTENCIVLFISFQYSSFYFIAWLSLHKYLASRAILSLSGFQIFKCLVQYWYITIYKMWNKPCCINESNQASIHLILLSSIKESNSELENLNEMLLVIISTQVLTDITIVEDIWWNN